jgi:signal transduction histidine kinase
MPRILLRIALLLLLSTGLRGEPTALKLTPEQQAWIAAHPVIRVGHDITYAPYSFRDERGGLVGIDLDFLALLAERTGLQFQNVESTDWPQMLEEFKAGRIDLFLSLGPAPERESFMTYTDPYTSAPIVIVTRNDAPYLFDVSELNGRVVAIPKGYAGLERAVQRNAPRATVLGLRNLNDCMEAVARGQAFATITDVVHAAYTIKTNKLTNLRLGSVVTSPSALHMGVRKDWGELGGILNAALATISLEDRKRINDRWISFDFAADRRWARAFQWAALAAAGLLVVGLLFVWRNRRLAAELKERRRLQSEIAQVSDEKSELLRMVAHDLRGPLTGLKLGVDFLRPGGVDPASQARTLDQMHDSLQQMIRLTNDLVDVTALEAGRRSFAWADTDAVGVLHESLGTFSVAAARKHIRLEFATEASAMLIRTDASALRQVTDNLVSNAIKFSPPEAVVQAGLAWSGEKLRLTVSDRGPGVNPAERDVLFEKYARGSAKPTAGEKSTGLGLWIVKRMADALGAAVWCEDTPGGGATFIVELPRQGPCAAKA